MSIKRLVKRKDLQANWDAADPILWEGEVGWATDTGVFKVGDGEKTWSALPGLSESAGGGGYRVIMRASHDIGNVPTEDLSTSRYTVGPDYTEAWSSGLPYLSPDFTWRLAGFNHPSWGALEAGDLCFDMTPGKLYRTKVNVRTFITANSTMFDQGGDSVSLYAPWLAYFPNEADGWNSSHGGFYSGRSFRVSGNPANDDFQISGDFSLAAVDKGHRRANGGPDVNLTDVFINDGPTSFSFLLSIGAYFSTSIRSAVAGTLATFPIVDILITEEDVPA
jgi:hypothetical protein